MFLCFQEKVEKQINEYQYEIKRLLNENDDIKKAFNKQIQNLSSQLQNIKAESENLVQVSSFMNFILVFEFN